MRPFGQLLFKLIAENEALFTFSTGPVFGGAVKFYMRDAAYNELGRETIDTLKDQWITDDEGRRRFARQMAQANSHSAEEVEAMYSKVGKRISVRIIWGKEDRWFLVKTAERLKKKLNARDVVLIDDAGRLVMYV